MMNYRIILIGLMCWLMIIGVSRGQEKQNAPVLLPPLPSESQDRPMLVPPLSGLELAPVPGGEDTPTLLPGQQSEWNALTDEEREQIFRPVNLDLKHPTQITIRTTPRVLLDDDDPSLGFIEPPPMRRNEFDVASDAISLDLYRGDGIEHPFYTPVAPFCYPPLYFEEPFVERYGDACCDPFQAALSGVHFYSNIALLPIKLLCEPPCRPTLNLCADPVDPAWGY